MRVLVVADRAPGGKESGLTMRMLGLYGWLSRDHSLTLAAPLDGERLPPESEPLFCRAVSLPSYSVVWPLENWARRLGSAALTRLGMRRLRDVVLLDPVFSLGHIAPVNWAVRRTLEEHLRQHRYDAVVLDHEALINMSCLNWPRDNPVILNSHNLLSSQLLSTRGSMSAGLYGWLALLKVLFYYEMTLCRRFDHVVAVSEMDQRRWQRRLPGRSVGVVPNGVDTARFSPRRSASCSKCDLVFVGGANYAPNRRAMIELADVILPLVRNEVPEATLTLVGRDPPMADLPSDPSVRVLGYVDDLRSALDDAAVFVAPIREGGGTRIKILTAMSMARPVVSTRLGAEGLTVQDGHDIVLADSPGDIAQCVVDLLLSPHKRDIVGNRARSTVVAKYEWEQVARELGEQVQLAVQHKRRLGAAGREAVDAPQCLSSDG